VLPRPSSARFAVVAVLAVSLLAYGCSSDSGTNPGGGNDTDPPAAPTGLVAVAAGSDAIALAWQDNSGDETGFTVESSPDGTGSWTQIGAPAADAEVFVDSGLGASTQRFYRVAAVGTAGVSAFSNVADATTSAAPPTTEAVVAEISASIESVIPTGTALADRNLLEEVRAAADAIRMLEGVDTVLVLEQELTVQSVMDDGIVHLFIHNRPRLEGLAPAAPPIATTLRAGMAGVASPPLRAAGDGPPKSANAVVISHDGGEAEANKVADLLSAAGYNILPLGASLDDMRQYKNLGALHLDTHGVGYVTVTKDDDGSLVLTGTSFALQTSTVIGSTISDLGAELLTGQLAIATVEDEAGGVTTKIAVTEKFIAQHWSFDEGVVMLHACYGGSGPFSANDTGGVVVDPTTLRLAILGAGARVVVAFDNLTWTSFAEPSILHFFDRMLGANEYEPVSPPLRPFDVDQVYADMQARNLLQFTRPDELFLGIGIGGNEVNVIVDRLPGRTTLAPSIEKMDVVDDVAAGDGELTLHGLFGDQQGTVEVEGVPVSVESWSAETIVARVPFQAGGSAGPVVVKKPTGVESNAAPLTEWRGTVTLSSVADGQLSATATLDVRFRADVHAFRASLTSDPAHREVGTYFSGASTGTVVGSGSITEGDVTTTWSGAYPMQMLAKPYIDNGVYPQTAPVMGGSARLDPDGGVAEICLAVWGIVDVVVQFPGDSLETTTPVAFLTSSLVDRMQGLLGCVDATLDGDNFFIAGDTRSYSPATGAELTLTWTDFVPFSPPTDQTPG